ncbi:uncharacterized protein J3R85_007582 [Psidium guajava]|nr:uncharacterized protein J3R85_007582 [Psidium guajava]
MAARSRSSGIAATGKRVVSQIWNHPPPSSLALRRAAHTSVYDKNPEDQVAPSVVPDEVIEAPSDKYWAPHPKTGVFGPATDHHRRAHGELPKPGNAESSVLEHTSWFRPTSLEDLEKPADH